MSLEISGHKLTSSQAGWALRWINILFTPSFILLPLSPPIGISEVGKIIAVFRESPALFSNLSPSC